jgi:hypothetical protein
MMPGSLRESEQCQSVMPGFWKTVQEAVRTLSYPSAVGMFLEAYYRPRAARDPREMLHLSDLTTWPEGRERVEKLLRAFVSSAEDTVVSPGHRGREELDRVREERDRLFIECEKLKSRVADERRTSARAQREYDQLKATLDKMLDQLNERARANDTLQAIVVERDAGRVCMQESYRGAVKHVHGDKVVVVFETEDDPLEQMYDASQFIDQKLPQVGDHIEVFVHAAKREVASSPV